MLFFKWEITKLNLSLSLYFFNLVVSKIRGDLTQKK